MEVKREFILIGEEEEKGGKRAAAFWSFVSGFMLDGDNGGWDNAAHRTTGGKLSAGKQRCF